MSVSTSHLWTCCIPKISNVTALVGEILFCPAIIVYFYLVFTNAEFFLLPVMAFDRYVAICFPLRYHALMSKRVYVSLAAAPWAFGIFDTLSYTILTSQLSYSLMNLSCSETSTIELITFIEGVLFGFTPLFLTLISYTYIIVSILKIQSVDGYITSLGFSPILDLNRNLSCSLLQTSVYFYLVFTNAEFFLLPVMAFDRYVAICFPLRYHALMSKRVCVSLAAAPWAFGILDTLSYTILTSQLSYCKSHVINHFFCDLTALMNLSCSETSTIELITLIDGVLFGFTPLFLTLISYTYIIVSILKIQSVDGRRKAFSTCSSHLTVVLLFYGTIIFMYMRPASEYSPAQDKLFAVFYTTVIPVMNPLIYSLRNRDVKNAFKKFVGRELCC
ncbi:olfactory receptor 5AR1-like [Pelodytes ibericus]